MIQTPYLCAAGAVLCILVYRLVRKIAEQKEVIDLETGIRRRAEKSLQDLHRALSEAHEETGRVAADLASANSLLSQQNANLRVANRDNEQLRERGLELLRQRQAVFAGARQLLLALREGSHGAEPEATPAGGDGPHQGSDRGQEAQPGAAGRLP
jgi:uncharacterized membrane protein YccC